MTVLRLAQFSGEIPRLLPRLLPDTGSQHAENVRLDDGGLTPVRKARPEHIFTGITGIQTIYKFGSTWLAWDKVVNAVPGPVAEDRLYYTGDGVPKLRVGTDVYPLAVPFPATALTGVVTGTGTGDVTTRLYVYTWVTDFDEESEPCPISNDIVWQDGQTITLSGFALAAGGRGISKQRIYRSQSSNQAGTDLFFIEERADSAANFVDTHSPEDFAEVLPSRDWNAPPDDLTGIISMPNGMIVGFSGKELCFCEPYRPHAWPEKYRLTAAFKIVGLGGYGTTVVAGTEGYPYVAGGNAPESMIEEKIEVNLPCINGRGLVDLGYSVAYPSNDGLVVVSNGSATVATDALFTRPSWQKLSPSTLIGGQFAGRYFASYNYYDLADNQFQGTIIIDLTGQQPFVLRGAVHPDAFYYDLPTGGLYFLLGNTVYEWDARGQSNEVMTWRSKRMVLPAPVSFGAILVEGNSVLSPDEVAVKAALEAEALAYNAAFFDAASMGSEVDGSAINVFGINGDPLQRMPPDKFIAVSVYADGVLMRVVTELNKAVRINGSRRAKIWEVQVNGTAEVEQITIATTMRELNEA